MKYSRFIEAHARLNAIVNMLSHITAMPTEATFPHLRILDNLLGLESDRWNNSGEIGTDAGKDLDGTLSQTIDRRLAHLDEPSRFWHPIYRWADVRFDRRISNNTTTPMIVIQARCTILGEILDQGVEPYVFQGISAPIRSDYMRVGTGELYEAIDSIDTKAYALRNGLLPYEVDCIFNQIYRPASIPSRGSCEETFLSTQLLQLFPEIDTYPSVSFKNLL